MNRILEYMVWLLITGLAYMFFCIVDFKEADAATVWTKQDGYFTWYKVGTQNRYLSTTEIDVPITWDKQDGTYIKCVSTGGANKYWQQGYDCYGKQLAPTETSCKAFMCVDDFGLTVDLTKNTVLECPRVKITKEQIAQFYEGKLAGIPSCRQMTELK